MPKCVGGRAKAVSHEITEDLSKKEAEKAIKEFAAEFKVKWAKAVEKITSEKEEHFPVSARTRDLRSYNPTTSVSGHCPLLHKPLI
jgi:hypothetical protein